MGERELRRLVFRCEAARGVGDGLEHAGGDDGEEERSQQEVCGAMSCLRWAGQERQTVAEM